MEPIPWREPFDDPAWQFEVKWDGVRCRAFCAGGRVRLVSRHGTEWTTKFPELTQALSAYSGVFDGEICALRDGRPDFPLMLRRLGQQSGRAYYVIFDCLRSAAGEDIRREPVEVRQRAIPAFARGPLQRIDSLPTLGTRLFAAVQASGLEGIVAKRLGSPYQNGRSELWRKVKCWRTLTAIAGRVDVRAGDVRSLELVGDDGLELGHVGPLSGAVSRELLERLHSGTEVRCRIRFLEWTDAGRIRQPTFIGFADD